ncbi:hypothetical protein TNCV_4586871 [Trichonephila clavipes]|nr:hypothetical protein TNCV_4586871 [Trichonephila clavipes]
MQPTAAPCLARPRAVHCTPASIDPESNAFWSVRRTNSDFVISERRTVFWKGILKHRVKMICKNTSIMVPCGHPPQDNERPQSTGSYCSPHHRRALSMFHGWNQTVNMKCFCRCSPRERMPGGLEQCK